MLRLVITLNQRVVEERTFTKKTRVTIGRTPDNDVQLYNPILSKHHLELARGAEGWEAIDLGSRNGVFIGGRRLERQPLRSGDALALGKFVISVTIEEGETNDEPDPEDGVPAYLTVKQAIYTLKRDAFQIGGAEGCDLRVTGLLTPQRLALVVRGRSGYRLVDVSPQGSGVYHNGKPLVGHCRLRDGDRFEVGGLLARFHGPRGGAR